MKGLYRTATGLVLVVLWLFFAGPRISFAAPFYPDPKGNINDYVGVLTAEETAKLEALADELWKKTETALAVAIIRTTEEESIKMYAVKLYERWGIGLKGKDKGLLLVVAVDDRKVTMEVGYGLEPVITDARAGRCLDEMTPYFKENQYGKGIYQGLLKAAAYIAEDAGVELELNGTPVGTEDEVGDVGWLLGILLPVVLVFLGLGAVIAILARPKCPTCGARLIAQDRIIQKATYSAGGLASRLYRCTRCGYTREKLYKTAPLIRIHTGFPGTGKTMGPGPWFGGFGGPSKGGGFSGPKGFGGGRSGGGGATRGW
ncbi:MAG: TPM domain-containing protein [Firmicutes bacterium]|nr:TPM domain-containing protein [Candidatus Fermentithermobacillaceae bacterium]